MFLRRDLTDDHNFGFPKIPIELCIIDKKKNVKRQLQTLLQGDTEMNYKK